MSYYFQLPGSVRIAGDTPVDGDRYLRDSIAERDALVTSGRAYNGLPVYTEGELYILKDKATNTWETVATGNDYIKNQTTAQQIADFWINGDAHVGSLTSDGNINIAEGKAYQIDGKNIITSNGSNTVTLGNDDILSTYLKGTVYTPNDGNSTIWNEGANNSLKSIKAVDASNISSVVFTLNDNTTISESFGHHHSEYALNDWVVGNFIKNQYTSAQTADMWIDGKVKATKHITIGGGADDFVKGDGSLVNKIDGGTW